MRLFYLWLCTILLVFTIPTFAQDEALTFTGTLDDTNPFYEYPLLVYEDDTTIIADSRATSGDLDTILYLLDDVGAVVAQNDNRSRGVLDAYIEYPSAIAGVYTLVLARYEVQDGITSGDFVLDVTLAPTITQLPAYDLSLEALTAVGYPTQAPATPAEWTVLAYYGGDNDLEGALIADLIEFERAGGSDATIHIVALLDRHPGYADADGDWHTTRLFYVTATRDDNAESLVITSTPLADLGDLDTGNGETLAQFLAWGMLHYPATHYALAFGSHGAGWAGVSTDYTASSIISLSELDHALSAIDQHLALVINDACLMSSVEYHAVLAQYADISFASPEIVVDPALDMTLFTNELRQQPIPSALPSIGQLLVDKYMTQDILTRRSGDVAYLTNAVTDLTMIDPLVDAIETFAIIFLENPMRHSAMLGVARSNAYVYTAFQSGASLIDLGSLMRQVIALSDDERLIVAAQAVIRALQESVMYGRGGERVTGRILYQNIYFPDRARSFDNAYFRHSPLKAWGDMLRAYYNALTPRVWHEGELFHPPIPPQVFITTQYPSAPSIHNPLRLAMEVVGRNIGRGIFIADYQMPDGSYERLIQSPILEQVLTDDEEVLYENNWGSGVEISTFFWDITSIQVTDGAIVRDVLVTTADETLSIEGRYREADGDVWYDVVVIFTIDEEDTSRYNASRIISRDPNFEALGVVNLAPDVIFQPYITHISVGGARQVLPDETITMRWGEQGVWLQAIPAPTGQYNLGFLIETFTGEQSLATVSAQVDNAGLDVAWRGYTDLTWGYTLLLPADWGDLVDIDSYYAAGSDPQGEIAMRVHIFELFEDEVFDIEIALDTIGFSVLDSEPFTHLGQSTVAVVYGDDAIYGYGVLLTLLDGDALFIGIETLSGGYDDEALEDLARTIITSVTLFDTTRLAQTDTALWEVVSLVGESAYLPHAVYYLPKSWAGQVFDDSIWIGSAPSGGNKQSPIAFRLTQVRADDTINFHHALLGAYVYTQADHEVLSERPYYAQFNTWFVSMFTYMQDGVPITGRLYTTVDTIGLGYAIFVHAPTDLASPLFNEVFEPLVDSFFIIESTMPYPLPDIGMMLNIPRGWDVPEDYGDYLLSYNPEETIEYGIEFYLHSTSYQDTLNRWLDDWGYVQEDDPSPITINGKDGLWVSFSHETEDDIFYGYGFITNSADGATGVVLYLLWLDDYLPEEDTVFTILSLSDYGVRSDDDGYEWRWQTGVLSEIGISITYPEMWGDYVLVMTEAGIYSLTIGSPSDATNVELFVASPAMLRDLLPDNFADDFDALNPQPTITVAGATAQVWDYQLQTDDGVITGVYVYFVGNNGLAYLIRFDNVDDRGAVDNFYKAFLSGIEIFALED